MAELKPETLTAFRHLVYSDVLYFLPIASYEQARVFVSNLKLVNAADCRDRESRERKINAGLMRFLNLRVTPDVAESSFRGMQYKELEVYLNRKYGDLLRHVAGFYRRNDKAPFRLNLPFRSAMYGYHGDTGHYNGILCQPLDRNHFYFLLSSSKYGGPKAIILTPQDQQYFTQFEEVMV